MPGTHKYCLGCSYILDGLPKNRCPECGRSFNPRDPHSYAMQARSRFPRPSGRLVAVFIIVLLVVGVGLPAIMAPGVFRFRKIVEKLQTPTVVRGWTEDGLILSDGRQVQLSDFIKLPDTSASLSEATQRGVEITNGRVYGLVRVHHWCGNDPVREHIARVDLSRMLMFLGEGEPVTDTVLPRSPGLEGGRRFSQWGWRVGEFYEFRRWCSRLDTPASGL